MHLRAGDILGAVGVLERQLGVRLASASATCGGNGSSEAKNKGLFHRLNQPHNVAKAGLEVVVLCLSQNDIPLARNAMTRLHNLQGFVGSGEETLAASLLSAFEDRDAGRIQEALSDNKLLFITSDISRIARNMKLKFATISTSKQSEQQNEEDEDFESLR
ncbi:hypothetical protein ERJ75_001346100 [Trypanosoma vivax]|nr:hypothetical protein ERJ75_001346100 [Trypanosoma vivax]